MVFPTTIRTGEAGHEWMNFERHQDYTEVVQPGLRNFTLMSYSLTKTISEHKRLPYRFHINSKLYRSSIHTAPL